MLGAFRSTRAIARGAWHVVLLERGFRSTRAVAHGEWNEMHVRFAPLIAAETERGAFRTSGVRLCPRTRRAPMVGEKRTWVSPQRPRPTRCVGTFPPHSVGFFPRT